MEKNRNGKTIKDVLTNIKDKYIGKVEIQSGKLAYVSEENMTEYEWAKEAFDGVASDFDKVSSSDTNSVQINNASAGKIESLKIYGNSTQSKRSGKNLFDISKVTSFVAKDNTSKRNTYSSISDGIITSKIGVYANVAYLYDSKITLEPGDYTLSADFMSDRESGNKGNVIGIYNLTLEKSDVKYYTLSDYKTWERKSHTFNIASTSEVIIVVQGSGQKDDYNDLNMKIKNIQLEEGTSVTDYEPYGVSPSPEFPSEVQSVGDLVTDTSDINYGKYKIPITVNGKNIGTAKQVYSGLTTESRYTETTLDGRECVGFIDNRDTQYTGINFKENTQYTFSFDYKQLVNSSESNNINAVLLCIYYTDDSNESIKVSNSNENVKWKNISYTSKANKTIKSIGTICYNYHFMNYIDINTFQIEEGNKETEYEPYTSTTNIYLNEPLRKVGNAVDYIDFKNKKVVRNVKVNDSTGTKTIDESYESQAPKEEKVDTPDISLVSGINNITVGTSINPSKIEVTYGKEK